jgi:3-deoxy-manno-octulosonate cytidylyltransferase (CMP-KDO synthetase)
MCWSARESGADRIIVATDHPDVARAVEAAGGEVCMTRADHQSGTERLAEVVEKCAFSDDTIIVNIQGDEPMIPPAIVRQVAENLAPAAAEWRRWRYRSTMRKRRLIQMR